LTILEDEDVKKTYKKIKIEKNEFHEKNNSHERTTLAKGSEIIKISNNL